MKSSPFVYGHTVSNSSFTNREKEISKLRGNLTSGINTMIISPRRWGKSSLVEKVVSEIKKDQKATAIVMVDLFSVNSEEEFLELLARETIKASTPKWQEWIKNGASFFRKLIPKLSVGLDPETDFSISFDWKELKKHSDEILNLPESIAIQKKIKVIVCVDEFQQIVSFKGSENLEKKIRAAWQKHKHATYCLYGSRRHMMSDIFNNPAKPFYRFGDIMLLPKINQEKWTAFIVTGFNKTGKKIDRTEAELISNKMQNHSWYVQQLAHYTWNLTESSAGRQEVYAALTELIQANTPLYQKELENLSGTQVNLLKAILKGESRLTSAIVMQSYQLGTPRNVSKNKTALVNNDLIYQLEDNFEIVDPAFEVWLRKLFFNEPLS